MPRVHLSEGFWNKILIWSPHVGHDATKAGLLFECVAAVWDVEEVAAGAEERNN